MSLPLVHISSSGPDTIPCLVCSRDPPRALVPSAYCPVRCRLTWSLTPIRTPLDLEVGECGCRDRRLRDIALDRLWRSRGIYDCLLASPTCRQAGRSSERSDITPDNGAFPVCWLCLLVDIRFPYEARLSRQLRIPSNGVWNRNNIWRTC